MSIARLTQLQTEMNRIVEAMIESYKPLKIILYGSVAKGTVHEYSDLKSWSDCPSRSTRTFLV